MDDTLRVGRAERARDLARDLERGAPRQSLACMPTSGDGTPVNCGADAGSEGWRVVPPPGVGDVQVMAQLDLTLG